MSAKYVWVEILLLGTAVALAFVLLLASLGAAGWVAAAQTAQNKTTTGAQAFDGMISCSRCTARHQPALDRSASACVHACVRDGASFALITSESTYILEGNLVSLRRLAGQRARVTGTRTRNIIKVASITAEG